MSDQEIRRVVIAGDGTAGLLAAAALSHQFNGTLDIEIWKKAGSM